ncbi:transposase [Roseomonas elaeocarpi]|uniref:Transposase n=1 Tax=Roseomonas elaeocarpi TaxID=907779 RepID=A0ABV6JVG6_9PROT
MPHAALSSTPSRLTPSTPWTPLSDDAWAALLPYVLPRSGPGRPIRDLRARMDAIFHLASTTDPWRALPAEYGKAQTVSRYFRRLTHAGLWQRLLHALSGDSLAPNHPLRAIEYLICRACRRAYRLIGLPLVLLVRRLGLSTALPGPPWMLPDPDLSQTLLRCRNRWFRRPAKRGTLTRWRQGLRAFQAVLRTSLGRRVRLSLRHGWA